MNTSILKKIDAFQLRAIRKILDLPTTYCDRLYTNTYIINKANEQLQAEHGRDIVPLSEYHKKRRIYMLAKLLVLGNKEPSSQVTMTQMKLAVTRHLWP